MESYTFKIVYVCVVIDQFLVVHARIAIFVAKRVYMALVRKIKEV